MKTSARGLATLELEEGVVLKAYLCPAGVWTIGAGLTAASGVVKPKAGMVISRDEASRLLALALDKNYEPAVERAMGPVRGAPQEHEFDAGVSFHFNTGAITKASWVKAFVAGAAPDTIRAGMLKWNKGGGKVLPGLTKRRKREADMLLKAVYPVAPVALPPQHALHYANWALPLDSGEKLAARTAMAKLGYPVGDKLDAIARPAVIAFQTDHGLTADGVIGRATLSTLQRRIDAARKAGPAVATPALAATGSATGAYDAAAVPPGADWLILGLTLAFALWTAWRYRDAVAALIHRPLPRLAALLRSF